MNEASSRIVRDHLRTLIWLTLASRLVTFSLVILSSLLPLFDSSPNILTSRWANPFLRWDAFHFAHIADQGYVYEHEWAFFPGTPLIMRLTAHALQTITRPDDVNNLDYYLLGGALAALSCDATHTLYRLTLHHLESPSIAFMTALVSLLPSSPSALRFASYSEPFYTYASYKGLLCCAQSQWLRASLWFAIAGAFRSNGILLAGFILWGILVQPFLAGNSIHIKTLIYATFLTSVTFIPFIYHHAMAYIAFCTTDNPAAWCSSITPSIYTHVQSTYWNVGFLRYWTAQQLPNFIISAPPLLLLFSFSIFHLFHSAIPQLRQSIQPSKPRPSAIVNSSPFLNPTITPHAIHALIICTTLLFASHTQIVLRVGPTMPVIYWAAAWLLTDHPRIGRWWVGWSIVWGAVSCVLWGTFLPPA